MWGLERGYCLMIGGTDVRSHARSDLRDAGARSGATRRSARPERRSGAAEQGYLHCGPSGAGHFVKMVHNGIEYGVMAAYAEGMNILKPRERRQAQARRPTPRPAPLHEPQYYQFDIDLAGRSPKSGGTAA